MEVLCLSHFLVLEPEAVIHSLHSLHSSSVSQTSGTRMWNGGDVTGTRRMVRMPTFLQLERQWMGGTSDDRELMACPVPLSSFRSVSLSSVARTSLMMKEERAERHRAQGIGIIILLLFPCQSVGLDRSRFHCLSSHLPRVTVSSSGVSVASGGTVMTRKGDHIINSLSIPTPVPPPKGWWSSWSYKSESFSVSILSLWSHLIVLTSWIERSMW